MKQTAQTIIPAEEMEAEMASMAAAFEQADLSEPLHDCARMADQAFARNFAVKSGPHSGPWAPRKRGGSGLGPGEGHPLLIKTAAMFLATQEFGAGHIEHVGTRDAVIGIDHDVIPYAAAQNFGHTYDNPLRILPQREFMDITDYDADQMTEVMADGVLEAID